MDIILIEGRFVVRLRSGGFTNCTEDWFSEPPHHAFVARDHAALFIQAERLDAEVVELTTSEARSLPLVFFVPDDPPPMYRLFGGRPKWMCVGSTNAKIRPDLQPVGPR